MYIFKGNKLIMIISRELIYSTTQQEIIDAVNLLTKSPWLSYKVNYSGTFNEYPYL
jgi:hypothetical protein